MKKIVSIAFVLIAIAGFAQNDTQTGTRITKLKFFRSSGEENELLSKNGHQILPKKGDWALGINALPILEFVGNVANANTDNDNIEFEQVEKNLPTATIWGKYFIADDLAWRGGVNLFATADRDRFKIDDDASTNPDDFVFDVRDQDQFGVTISLGLEKRRGKSRVQGVYGADAFVHFETNNTTKWDFGNAITASNQEPSTTNAALATSTPPTGTGTQRPNVPELGYRLKNADLGNSFEFGLRGFIGVEYFFAPKMSVGGEFYWAVSYTTFGETSLTYEHYEGSQNSVIESSTFTEGNRDFEMGFDNTSAAINMFFYF